jgi:hypothetical protein
MVVHRQSDVLIGSETDADAARLNSDLADVAKEVIQAAARVARLPADRIPGQLALGDKENKRFESSLKVIAAHDFNQIGAGTRKVVGSYNISIRNALYNIVISGAAVSGAMVAVFAEPVTGGLALVAAAADAVERIQRTVTHLTPSQIPVYEALLEIQRKLEESGRDDPRVTAADIEALFRERKQASKEVAERLEEIKAHKNAILKSIDVNGTKEYWTEED